MVRGGTMAHIARTVRAAAGRVSRRVSRRAAANLPAPSQGMAARGRSPTGIRHCAGRPGQQERKARLWRRWPATALWICHCAWKTLARRPQLHRLHNNKQAFSIREEGLGNFSAGNMRQREHLDEATVACWVTFSGEAIRLPIQIAALQIAFDRNWVRAYPLLGGYKLFTG